MSGNNSFVRILTESVGCSLQRVLSRKVEAGKHRLKVGEANFDVIPKPHLARAGNLNNITSSEYQTQSWEEKSVKN